MADYNFDNKEVDNIVASYTVCKGKYTTASRKLELLLDLQSKNYSAVTATNINDQLAKLKELLTSSLLWLNGWRLTDIRREKNLSPKLPPGQNRCESLPNPQSRFIMTVDLVKTRPLQMWLPREQVQWPSLTMSSDPLNWQMIPLWGNWETGKNNLRHTTTLQTSANDIFATARILIIHLGQRHWPPS